MASLADVFGDDFKQQRIRPGAVVYMDVDFTDHPKYLLIACCEPECLVFVINSEINEFYHDKPNLYACHVDLPYEDHKFMQHDSYINCVDVNRTIPLSEIIGKVNGNYDLCFKGDIMSYCVRNILHAVEDTPVMSPIDKQRVTDALTPYS